MKKMLLLLLLFWGNIAFGGSCVSQWKMNDNATSETVVDSVGDSNGTSQQNTEDINIVGKVGGALMFNGTSDYVTTTTFEEILKDSCTFNFWCEPDDGQPENNNALLNQGPSPQANSFRVSLTTEGKMVGSYDDATQQSLVIVSDEVLFSEGTQTWNMITLIIEKTTETTATMYLYFNGIFVESVTGDCVMSSFISQAPLQIGKGVIGGTTRYFAGLIDNVMIFNKALTQAEITALYNNGCGTEMLGEIDPVISPRRTNNIRARYEN